MGEGEGEGEAAEYVLLDLDDVCAQVDIPPNAPYVLSGLDTLNPFLTLGTGLKLIGEYQETVGTCYLFSEKEGEMEVMPPETGSSERDLFKDACIIDSNQAPSKEVEPIASLQKILKFRTLTEGEMKTAEAAANAKL